MSLTRSFIALSVVVSASPSFASSAHDLENRDYSCQDEKTRGSVLHVTKTEAVLHEAQGTRRFPREEVSARIVETVRVDGVRIRYLEVSLGDETIPCLLPQKALSPGNANDWLMGYE